MTTLSAVLTSYIVKRYNINIDDATMIVNDEFDYIEERFESDQCTIASISKELIEIYMVA